MWGRLSRAAVASDAGGADAAGMSTLWRGLELKDRPDSLNPPRARDSAAQPGKSGRTGERRPGG